MVRKTFLLWLIGEELTEAAGAAATPVADDVTAAANSRLRERSRDCWVGWCGFVRDDGGRRVQRHGDVRTSSAGPGASAAASATRGSRQKRRGGSRRVRRGARELLGGVESAVASCLRQWGGGRQRSQCITDGRRPGEGREAWGSRAGSGPALLSSAGDAAQHRCRPSCR